MEYRKSHHIVNDLLEARNELHSNLGIQTALIERIQQLPEDDYCRSGRENLQLGAGLGYLEGLDKQAGTTDTERSREEVLDIYFATQPHNRYIDAGVAAFEKQSVTLAALSFLETGSLPELEACVDPYQVEAACSFIEGYELVVSMARTETVTAEILAS